MLKCIWFGVLAFTAEFVWAAQPIEEELIVTASLEETIPLQLGEYGNRIEVISAEQIEVGGFNDLGQTLQMLVPGLYLAPKNGAFDYMNCSLQGSRCQDILWLIDGVRINNRLYNTTSPLDTVPAHMVERIEVLYGGQGIFYGTQSVGGVVNVVTKAFADGFEGGVSVGFDENDGTHVNADIRGGSGVHRFVVYASYDDADGFRPFRSEDYQPSGSDRERGYEVVTVGRQIPRRRGSARPPQRAVSPHRQRSGMGCSVQPRAVLQRAGRRPAYGQAGLPVAR